MESGDRDSDQVHIYNRRRRFFAGQGYYGRVAGAAFEEQGLEGSPAKI